ncbi:hypothetical protein M3Y99_01759600 [Aphelenchoides fujianensis]|nr:hypothetical protein M3Y99_01759600 [Aphelenchoides fujianensis]
MLLFEKSLFSCTVQLYACEWKRPNGRLLGTIPREEPFDYENQHCHKQKLAFVATKAAAEDVYFWDICVVDIGDWLDQKSSSRPIAFEIVRVELEGIRDHSFLVSTCFEKTHFFALKDNNGKRFKFFDYDLDRNTLTSTQLFISLLPSATPPMLAVEEGVLSGLNVGPNPYIWYRFSPSDQLYVQGGEIDGPKFFYRCDVEQKKWERVPFETRDIDDIAFVVNPADGHEDGVLICRSEDEEEPQNCSRDLLFEE